MTDPHSPSGKPNHLIIIADVGDASDNVILIQDVSRDGLSFIPVFSSEDVFKKLTDGSGFEEKGVSIDIGLLFSMLRGDETLILNPGSDRPWIIKAWDRPTLKDAV